jgi:hypothetical protein
MLVTQIISYSIHFRPCTQQTPEVALGLQVFDWEKHQNTKEYHSLSSLLVISSESRPPLHEKYKVCNVVRHLGSGSRGSVFELNESILELTGHTNNHMIEIWIEVLAFGDLHTIWRFKVVASHNVVDIVDSSRSKSDFSEISWPYTSVGILGLILREVGSIDMIMNVSVSFVPFLIVVLFVVVVSRVDCEVLSDPGR